MKVFGLTGIEESNMNLGKLSPNSYDIIWSGIDKPAGIYLYELSIGDRHDIGRIILVK